MTNNDKTLCPYCRKLNTYTIKYGRTTRNEGGKDYTFTEKYATCDYCGNIIMPPGFQEENVASFKNVYMHSNNLVTPDDIQYAMEKYNIGKRPLSLALGFGEITITRYLNGQIPSVENSNKIKRIIAYHTEMAKLLEHNREKLAVSAYTNCAKELDKMDKLTNCSSKIEAIARYIVHSEYEITNMALQKILYYIQGFSLAILNYEIFQNDCFAWKHGPVFPDIYQKYKSFGSAPIIDPDAEYNIGELTNEIEMSLIDNTISALYKYNGSFLRKITHKENPWKITREGYADYENCDKIISKNLIKSYFTDVNKKFDLTTKTGIDKYIQFKSVQ